VADVLIDTDVFVDHLRGARRLAPPSGRVCYSTVTRCELFAGRHVDEEVVRRLLAPFAEIPVERDVAERAGRIRRASGAAGRALRTPDAIVAASALENGLTLWTRNGKDFAGIARLSVRAPRG
jgi:hypothetical protein